MRPSPGLALLGATGLLVALGARAAQAEGQGGAMRWEDLRHVDPAEGARVRALRAWIEGRSAGFQRRPLARRGNFVGEAWAGPGVARAALDGGAVVGSLRPGDAWRALDVFAHPGPDGAWTDAVFGLGLALGDNPAGPGVAVHLSLTRGGRTVVGDGFGLTCVVFPEGGGPPARAWLGDAVAIDVREHRVRLAAPGGWRAELERLAASPASFAEVAAGRHDALAREVARALDAGEVQGWDEGPYLGDGAPPERTPRALRPDERAAARAAAEAELARRRALLVDHADALWRALHERLPVRLLLDGA